MGGNSCLLFRSGKDVVCRIKPSVMNGLYWNRTYSTFGICPYPSKAIVIKGFTKCKDLLQKFVFFFPVIPGGYLAGIMVG
jgi:hypothetical protein